MSQNTCHNARRYLLTQRSFRSKTSIVKQIQKNLNSNALPRPAVPRAHPRSPCSELRAIAAKTGKQGAPCADAVVGRLAHGLRVRRRKRRRIRHVTTGVEIEDGRVSPGNENAPDALIDFHTGPCRSRSTLLLLTLSIP